MFIAHTRPKDSFDRFKLTDSSLSSAWNYWEGAENSNKGFGVRAKLDTLVNVEERVEGSEFELRSFSSDFYLVYQLWISPLRDDTFGKSTAYSSPTSISILDRVARSSVTNTDGTKYRPWKAVFWYELNRLSSSERRWSKIGSMMVLRKYSEGLDADMLALWC